MRVALATFWVMLLAATVFPLHECHPLSALSGCTLLTGCLLLPATACRPCPMCAGVAQMCEAAKRLGVPPPVSIQNDFAPVYRHYESELAETCAPSAYNLG